MLRHELRRRTIGDSGFRWNTKTRPSVSAGGRSSSAGGLRICGPQCGLAHTYSALSARRRCRGWFVGRPKEGTDSMHCGTTIFIIR